MLLHSTPFAVPCALCGSAVDEHAGTSASCSRYPARCTCSRQCFFDTGLGGASSDHCLFTTDRLCAGHGLLTLRLDATHVSFASCHRCSMLGSRLLWQTKSMVSVAVELLGETQSLTPL